MLNTVLIFLTIIVGLQKPSTSYTIDVTSSEVRWVGKKVTGQHSGTVQIKEGVIDLKKGRIVGGTILIDMNTIACSDITGGSKLRLENHLKSADFFSVKEFPTSSFIITRAEQVSDYEYHVMGEITIKGVTEVVEFPLVLEITEDQVKGSCSLVIDRSKFGVKYRSKSYFDIEDLGDKLIYDDFELVVTFVAK